mmetsp:Transcript_16909/g.40308  ORF Transcript_16909/g.40308 Transcript_16909/m.40308 type:complete len:265 (-) Transcript_16909:2568-3362(-)
MSSWNSSLRTPPASIPSSPMKCTRSGLSRSFFRWRAISSSASARMCVRRTRTMQWSWWRSGTPHLLGTGRFIVLCRAFRWKLLLRWIALATCLRTTSEDVLAPLLALPPLRIITRSPRGEDEVVSDAIVGTGVRGVWFPGESLWPPKTMSRKPRITLERGLLPPLPGVPWRWCRRPRSWLSRLSRVLPAGRTRSSSWDALEDIRRELLSIRACATVVSIRILASVCSSFDFALQLRRNGYEQNENGPSALGPIEGTSRLCRHAT